MSNDNVSGDIIILGIEGKGHYDNKGTLWYKLKWMPLNKEA